ncbi:DoxX family membrane protein [Corynebacterium otitidis]|uniref:DoxX family protein n=2 Tax=Corynebacterium otitidis ATCC 51513 TaxID=883169 RepID=I7KJ89_9CORY|nr:DoxX family membrane protein [Corynebacterium otitidis]CCI83455.1 hypothetical protein BN46_0723 [Corynebacterium otitidis ATCC 51513]
MMIRKIARPLLASAYVIDGVDSLVNTREQVEGTRKLLQQVGTFLPTDVTRQLADSPETTIRVLGGTKVGAGTLLSLGKLPRLSAAVLAATTVPTILTRYAFWDADSEEDSASKKVGFTSHVALLGGLAITSVDTEGKPSLSYRASKAGKKARKKAGKVTSGSSSSFADSARDFLSDASDRAQEAASKAQEYVDDNKDDWIDAAKSGAQKVSETVSDYTDRAVDYFNDNKDDWLAAAQDNAKTARKGVVKAAAKAQDRADEVLAKADKKSGRKAKKLRKKASSLQKDADKALNKAKKKLRKYDLV